MAAKQKERPGRKRPPQESEPTALHQAPSRPTTIALEAGEAVAGPAVITFMRTSADPSGFKGPSWVEISGAGVTPSWINADAFTGRLVVPHNAKLYARSDHAKRGVVISAEPLGSGQLGPTCHDQFNAARELLVPIPPGVDAALAEIRIITRQTFIRCATILAFMEAKAAGVGWMATNAAGCFLFVDQDPANFDRAARLNHAGGEVFLALNRSKLIFEGIIETYFPPAAGPDRPASFEEALAAAISAAHDAKAKAETGLAI